LTRLKLSTAVEFSDGRTERRRTILTFPSDVAPSDVEHAAHTLLEALEVCEIEVDP
jgi:hypothetical protein